MSKPIPQSAGKQPYRKPRLIPIELAPREVLGLGCKLQTGGNGVMPPTCLAGGCSIVPGS